MPASPLDGLLEQTLAVVTNAGRIVAANIHENIEISKKGRIDLVTEIDVKTEEYLKDHLKRVLPSAEFLAEESSDTQDKSAFLQGPTWVIDPLDGTTNYAHQLPWVAVSVALWDEGRPQVGVINLPLLGEILGARAEGGTFLNGQPARVSKTKNLEQSLIATGFPYDIETYLKEILTNFETLLPKVQGIRRPGAAALDMAYVACGRFDGFYESALKPWDTAAGVLLVAEAGGLVSRYDGKTPYQPGDASILAANPALHGALAELLWERES